MRSKWHSIWCSRVSYGNECKIDIPKYIFKSWPWLTSIWPLLTSGDLKGQNVKVWPSGVIKGHPSSKRSNKFQFLKIYLELHFFQNLFIWYRIVLQTFTFWPLRSPEVNKGQIKGNQGQLLEMYLGISISHSLPYDSLEHHMLCHFKLKGH